MKLIQSSVFEGRIELLTGLHIGAGKDAIEIGGVDKPVVKHPHTGEPFIPGSSLKGKLRCLMEWATGRVDAEGNVWAGGDEKDPSVLARDPVLRIFGTTNPLWEAGPTRLVVRDAFLDSEWKSEIISRGLPLTEEKFENNIDRIQGKAGVGIRRTERVPAGAIFRMEMVYRVFDLGDDGETDRNCLKDLFRVLRLLENDALGGSGSRGYGRLRFLGLTLDGRDIQPEFEAVDPKGLIPGERAA
jgi:CRISPR-associated protein Csm3